MRAHSTCCELAHLPTMKRNHLALAGVFACCVLLSQALSGPSFADDEATAGFSPPLGKRITVHLRKDALGMANNYASDPVLEKSGNIEVSLTGILEALNDDWVVLKLNTGNYWVARDTVLLLASDQ